MTYPLWRHARTGDVYAIAGPTVLQENTLEPLIIYAKHPGKNHQAGMMLPGPYWARAVDKFLDGRFVQLSQEEVKTFLGQ